MSATRHLLYFTVVNGAFERLTVNWLCNTLIFKGLHDLVLIVSTSKSLCESVHSKFNEKLACMFMNLPGFEEDLDWGEQKYINFLTIRAQLMRMLIESSVRFVLIETDSTWFRDPIDLFINATVIDDADIVVPSKGYAPKGDNLGFSPMLVESTNTSIALFDEINRRLLGNDSLYDQDVLNELCSMQYHGVVCRIFAYSEIADGKWFHLNERVKNSMKPFIVNNNFYVGLQNKETRQDVDQFRKDATCVDFISIIGCDWMHTRPTDVRNRRSERSAIVEGFFAAFTLALGVVELSVNGEHLCGYLLLCVSFMLFCLFIEFYLGVTYNCWPLLICHAAQASGLCLSLFVLIICTMLFTFPDQITVLSFRLTTRIVFLTIVVAMTLLGTFAVSSFHRARELWSYETCHIEHLRRLLIDALEGLAKLRMEHHNQYTLTSAS